MSAVTNEIDDQLERAGLTYTVPSSNVLAQLHHEGDPGVRFNSLLYADDVVFPRTDQSGQQLLKASAICQSLAVNQGPGKTELVVHFPRQSSELKAGLVVASHSRVTAVADSVGLADQGSPDKASAQAKEVRTRRAQAFDAVTDMAAVLKQSHVPLRLKIDAVASKSVSRLTLGTHNWYTKRDLRSLARGYYRILRSAAGATVRASGTHASLFDLIKVTKMPTFEAL
eukprot:4587139-Amphidinium_carterae.1